MAVAKARDDLSKNDRPLAGDGRSKAREYLVLRRPQPARREQGHVAWLAFSSSVSLSPSSCHSRTAFTAGSTILSLVSRSTLDRASLVPRNSSLTVPRLSLVTTGSRTVAIAISRTTRATLRADRGDAPGQRGEPRLDLLAQGSSG